MRSGSFLLFSSSVIAIPLAAAPAWGADTSGSAPDAASVKGETIVVTGQRLAKTARAEQKKAMNIQNIQSAETIAKYPDVNSAEALSRMPGVSLSIDTAEGRYVNIRGLDGNFNGATFGGVVLLNTSPSYTYFNAAGRAVEFDTVPIGAVDRMIVTKTGLPDHDAEGIGGSVELSPRTAIGAKRLYAHVTLGGGIETDQNTGLYRDEVVVGGPLGGTNADGDAPFSFVLSQFLYNDKRSFDDLESAYINDQVNGTPDKAFDALELRRYNYNRKRFGYSGEFDFTPNSENRIFLRANVAGYNERVLRNRLEIDGLGDSVVTDPSNAKGFIATGASTVKTLRDSDVKEQNVVLQLGGDHHLGTVHIDWFAAYSRATYKKYTDYNTEFAGPSDLTIAYDNTTNPDYPVFKVLGGGSVTDPANYALDTIKNATENSRDREWSYALNAATPLHLAADDELKIGGKLRYREKISAPYAGKYAYDGATLLLSDAASGSAVTNFYNTGTNIGPNIDTGQMTKLFNGSGTALSLDTGSYFDDTENIAAAYIQYRASIGKLGILTGVRYEHTKAIYRGIGDSIMNGAVQTGPLSTPHSYDNVFPTLQLRYQAMPNLIARATYSTGIARPGFYQTLQATSIDVGGGVVSTGNPDLKPMYGHSFDASLEYYLPDSGIISVGAFDKEIKSFIVTRAVRGSYPGITGTALIQTYENVSGAYARGIEANFVDKFTGLPGLLGGLGIDANLTYVSSAVALRDGEGSVAMPGTIPWSWNAAVFYERGPVQLRLSSQFESTVLFGVSDSRATDVFQDSRYTLDFNGSYDFSKNVQFYANAKNLTNAPLRFYEGTPNRPIQREFYDVTLEGGVKLRF
ncbi:TonB-dependent receptor [Novosphingobium pentaromativorans]|uniref:TonB-dependent receptor n=1 Tax=Novosphingobium pentaromativorans TaxID=205844 RepID=UPI0009D983E4|nr:TonB-dependent receptor [Novosphingobium pentaromativorans]